MATILIKPITVQSVGGYSVTLDGLDPSDTSCLHGNVATPGAGKIEGRWDLGGTLSNGSKECNLDMSGDEMSDLASLARHLGAKDA